MSDHTLKTRWPNSLCHYNTSSFEEQKVQEFIQDKNYVVTGYLHNVTVDSGRLVYATMNDDTFMQYASLKRAYPEEFEKIRDELGKPVI